MTILNTFRSSRRLHTERRGGAGDCDICSQQVEKFEKLNCTGCSDKSSKICTPCANIIKTIGDNCPMCRGKIDRSIEKLSERIAATKKVKNMKLLERLSSPPRRPASALIRPASPPRRPASALRRPASPPRRPASPPRRPTPASMRPASASRRPASPPRRPAPASRRPAPASRRLSPNTERDIKTQVLSENNRVSSVRKSASAASRREISRNRI